MSQRSFFNISSIATDSGSKVTFSTPGETTTVITSSSSILTAINKNGAFVNGVKVDIPSKAACLEQISSALVAPTNRITHKTIGEILHEVIDQLSRCDLDFAKGNEQFLTLSIDSKYKDVITFLFELSIVTLDRPYNTIKTDITSDLFTYRMSGDADKIRLLLPTDQFSRQGKTITDFLNNLRPSVLKLINKLSSGWNYSSEGIINGKIYENSTISGTYYVFLLKSIIKVLNIDGIYFSCWNHFRAGHDFADRIYLHVDEASIKKFISSIKTELSMRSTTICEQKRDVPGLTCSPSRSLERVDANKLSDQPDGNIFSKQRPANPTIFARTSLKPAESSELITQPRAEYKRS
jgi:hypothetical protein